MNGVIGALAGSLAGGAISAWLRTVAEPHAVQVQLVDAAVFDVRAPAVWLREGRLSSDGITWGVGESVAPEGAVTLHLQPGAVLTPGCLPGGARLLRVRGGRVVRDVGGCVPARRVYRADVLELRFDGHYELRAEDRARARVELVLDGLRQDAHPGLAVIAP